MHRKFVTLFVICSVFSSVVADATASDIVAPTDNTLILQARSEITCIDRRTRHVLFRGPCKAYEKWLRGRKHRRQNRKTLEPTTISV